MQQVNNAIIMAAGVSSRFAPLSYELPKAFILTAEGNRSPKNKVYFSQLSVKTLCQRADDPLK
jgi:CTP:phosphocholine cytidylyltransferase-like protein